jgi:DNA-binding Lrp family transcriptional regulator
LLELDFIFLVLQRRIVNYVMGRFLTLPRGWFEEGVKLGEMDDTDRKLMLLIYENPRIPLQEIAKRLGISRQAVNHRMQVLTRIGVFRSVRASISQHYLDAVAVAVWGRSKAASVEKNLDRLGESEFTSRAIVAGGNDVYVIGVLRSISELDGYVGFVKGVVEMPEPTVGIVCFGDGVNPDAYDGGIRKQSPKELSPQGGEATPGGHEIRGFTGFQPVLGPHLRRRHAHLGAGELEERC